MNNTRKDILFLCQFFYPSYNSSATLPFDTAKYLASSGFTVDALVGYPSEYSKDKHLPLRESVEGVNIRRVKYAQLNRAGKLGRLINYFSLTFNMLLKTNYLKNYKVVIVYSNPPILPVVPLIAKKLYGTRFIFVAYDVYPEVAFASNTLSPGSIISKMMNIINKKLYSTVDCVIALTDEMKRYLLKMRPELFENRVEVISNWAHEKIGNGTQNAYERFGYRKDQFIVSYFGNMGTCQDVKTMLKAAIQLKNNDDIRFLIVGHGNKKDAIAKIIEKKKLKNIQLLDFLTGEEFEQAIRVSSCCIVSLEKGLKGMCAPSKYYSYLQGGKPVLAVVEKGSYLAEEVNQEKIGYSVEIGDAVGLKNAILNMAADPEKCKKMGDLAGKLYDNKYTYEIAMGKYISVLADKCKIKKTEDNTYE